MLKFTANTVLHQALFRIRLSIIPKSKLTMIPFITAQQIKELQRRNAQLEEENLIKKAIAIFTPHPDKG